MTIEAHLPDHGNGVLYALGDSSGGLMCYLTTATVYVPAVAKPVVTLVAVPSSNWPSSSRSYARATTWPSGSLEVSASVIVWPVWGADGVTEKVALGGWLGGGGGGSPPPLTTAAPGTARRRPERFVGDLEAGRTLA